MKDQKAITLIALIITIIILVILAAVAIRAVYNMGIVNYAVNGTQDYAKAAKAEEKTMQDTENFLSSAIERINEAQASNEGPTGKPLINKNTVSDYVTGTNLVGEDRFGNPITIPVGFKVAEDSGADVTEGIVIEDNDIQTDGNGNQRGNQYVWIPTGTVYKNKDMTEYETITPGRYEFADGTSTYTKEDETTVTPSVQGTPVLKQSLTNYATQPTNMTYSGSDIPDCHKITSATNSQIVIDGWFYEDSTYRVGVAQMTVSLGMNRTAFNLSGFATSVATNHGYYIARYEASWWTGNEVKSRVSNGTPLTSSGTRTDGQLWNFINEIDAAGYCQNMYNGVNSDLMNSYAWDTAIVYIQTFSGDEDYSYQTSRNTGSNPANTGINNDEVCKINDMASNVSEKTTEFSTYQNSGNAYPCVQRGGYSSWTGAYTATRTNTYATGNRKDVSFRPILYL